MGKRPRVKTIDIIEMLDEAGYVYCEECSEPNWKVYHPENKHTKIKKDEETFDGNNRSQSP
jgi:hypothetical protein